MQILIVCIVRNQKAEFDNGFYDMLFQYIVLYGLIYFYGPRNS